MSLNKESMQDVRRAQVFVYLAHTTHSPSPRITRSHLFFLFFLLTIFLHNRLTTLVHPQSYHRLRISIVGNPPTRYPSPSTDLSSSITPASPFLTLRHHTTTKVEKDPIDQTFSTITGLRLCLQTYVSSGGGKPLLDIPLFVHAVLRDSWASFLGFGSLDLGGGVRCCHAFVCSFADRVRVCLGV